MQNNPRNAINFRHLFSCLINKVTLWFAHELEKSCETLVPRVSSCLSQAHGQTGE